MNHGKFNYVNLSRVALPALACAKPNELSSDSSVIHREEIVPIVVIIIMSP